MAYDVKKNFTNHPPANESVSRYFDRVTAEFIDLAGVMDSLLDDSREKSLCLTNLEQASMWAKAAIARNQNG